MLTLLSLPDRNTIVKTRWSVNITILSITLLKKAVGEQGMAQWWERSPPTNVVRVQIPASTPYVGCVCCWFSPLLWEVFLRILRFFPSSKTNTSKFQFDQESGRRRTTLWMCYLRIIICYYLFIYLFIYLNEKNLIHIITHPPTVCVRDGRKKTVETWLSIRERKAESGSSKGGISKKDQMKDAG